jgi:hypothetical protein
MLVAWSAGGWGGLMSGIEKWDSGAGNRKNLKKKVEEGDEKKSKALSAKPAPWHPAAHRTFPQVR